MRSGIAMVAALIVVLGLGLAAGGYEVSGWLSALSPESAAWAAVRTPELWTDLPPIYLAPPALSAVDYGLLGVIVVLLAVLAGVLARGRYSAEALECQARETRLVQDLHRGFVEMDQRLESLESVLLKRTGGVLGSKPN